MILPGETEAGTAGTQPCRGISRWAQADERGREDSFLRHPTSIGSKDPYALKIPARRAEYSLTENVASPFHAEPRQSRPIFEGDRPAPSAPLAQNSVPNLGDLHADNVRYHDFVNCVPGSTGNVRIMSVYRMGWQDAFDSCKPLVHRSSGLGNSALVDQTSDLLRSGQSNFRNVSGANHTPSKGIVVGDAAPENCTVLEC